MELKYALTLAKRYKTLLNKNGVNTRLRLAHFFAQAYAESKFEVISENLNYSEATLLKVFGKYFNKTTAKQYARKPEAIANVVYANRMGNGNTKSGDGWRYRGRWFFQITGKNNYIQVAADTKINYLTNPEAYMTEADAMITALWYWNERNLNRYADQDDVDGVSDVINIGRKTTKIGYANGYKERYSATQELKKLF